MALYRCLF